MMMVLTDTIPLMISANYKDRFVAEYHQTKIRYEKLKKFNTKIEASRATNEYVHWNPDGKTVDMPVHDCPDDLLRHQQSVMGEYLHILEVRAIIEGIEL